MASTHLITFTFQTSEAETGKIVEIIQGLQSLWENRAIDSMLFRDAGEPGKMMLLLLTEKHVDEVTRMIQEEPGTRHLFQKIRDTKSRLLISFMDRVV
jgi:hypothetical protein